MSASNVQPALSTLDWHLDFVCDTSSRLLIPDPSIDDPVNDTGLSAGRGDLQLADEFACLVRLICDGSGDFS